MSTSLLSAPVAGWSRAASANTAMREIALYDTICMAVSLSAFQQGV
jgi:hypothetical protein